MPQGRMHPSIGAICDQLRNITVVAASAFHQTPEHDQIVDRDRDDHVDRNYQQDIDWYDRFRRSHRGDPSRVEIL